MMKLFLFAWAIIFVMIADVFAQTDLQKAIPVDNTVKIGKFDNGLTYYIKQNGKPEKRIEMRLVVNAGSLYEDDDQQGLAHFCEHMCFNGTKNFPKGELVNFLEKMGIKFGGDLNAYTSFAETVYMLFIPTDNDTLLEKGFQVLEDWAHNVSLEDKEIDKERGVIVEEWRLGLGAEDRMRKKSFPVIFKDSRYADRIPIGKKEILEKFKYETIKRFYHEWYRPNLMSVVIVGDIDPTLAEQKIKAHFEGLKNPADYRERKEYGLPDNEKPLVSIVTDKEATSNSVMFFYKHPHKIQQTLDDYRESLTAELYNEMLNARIGELTQKPECPFIFGYNAYSEFLARTSDAYMGYGMMKENQINEGFELLLTESQRVKQHGFNQSELDRQKEKMLSDLEKRANEADKTESGRIAQRYINNFLSKDPIPGPNNEFKIAKELLPLITIDDVNKLAAKWITDKNFVVMVNAPEKEGLKVPTEKEILDIVNKVKGLTLEPYVDKVSNNPLLENIPEGTKVTSKKENSEYGFTELTFANGVKAVLKPTDFKNDEILMSAYSLGGISQYPDKDIMSATFSSTVISQSGIAGFDNVELEKKLTGKEISLSPNFDEQTERFEGNATPKDLETLLQLTYLYFTQPRIDTAAFLAFMSKTKNQMKFFRSSPQIAFSDTLVKTITSNSPRSVALPSEKQLDMVDMSRCFEIFKDRYADASDFTFFFVGNFDIETITPLLEKYLGGLPSTNRKEMWKDVDPKFPAGVTEVSIKKGMEDKSMVAVVISDVFTWTDKEKLDLKIATEILNIKLRESMREDQSGVYGVQVMQRTEKFPTPEYQLFIAFGCNPKNVKALVKTIFNTINELRKNGPQQVDLDKVKENLLRDRETDLKKNKFWLNTLEDSYYYEQSASDFLNYTKNVSNITIDDIKQTAIKYFTPEHYAKVVLMPEKKK